jgi:O-antigen/teichoic acid export membrane protein
MSTVQRIAKNTGVLLVAQVASYLLSFFCMMYTARYLGTAGYGILSFALAFTGIFGVFGDLGLQTLMVREVARDKSLASKYLANVSLMKIILVAVTFGVIALTINLLGYPEQTIKVVYLLALSVIFAAFTGMFYSIFQAFERMEFVAIGQMLNAALLLGGVILVMKLGFSIIGFASLYFMVSIVTLVYSFAILKWKLFNPALAWSPRMMEFGLSFWKPAIKEALPFGLTMIFVTVFYWISTVMLSFMKGDTEGRLERSMH